MSDVSQSPTQKQLVETLLHNLRTPMFIADINAKCIQDCLPVLIKTYNMAKQRSLSELLEIDPYKFSRLEESLSSL